MYAKLNPLKLGLASGILWSLTLFILTWISMYTGWAMFWLSQWMDIYPALISRQWEVFSDWFTPSSTVLSPFLFLVGFIISSNLN